MSHGVAVIRRDYFGNVENAGESLVRNMNATWAAPIFS